MGGVAMHAEGIVEAGASTAEGPDLGSTVGERERGRDINWRIFKTPENTSRRIRIPQRETDTYSALPPLAMTYRKAALRASAIKRANQVHR